MLATYETCPTTLKDQTKKSTTNIQTSKNREYGEHIVSKSLKQLAINSNN